MQNACGRREYCGTGAEKHAGTVFCLGQQVMRSTGAEKTQDEGKRRQEGGSAAGRHAVCADTSLNELSMFRHERGMFRPVSGQHRRHACDMHGTAMKEERKEKEAEAKEEKRREPEKEAGSRMREGTKNGKPEERELRVGFVGNPNCGKTTLFNAYTGARR